MSFLQNKHLITTIILALLLTTKSTIAQSYNALIIGIEDYTANEKLKTPVNDAKKLSAILTAKYGFKSVTTLTNESATKENIFKSIKKYQEDLTEQDHFLIFYSGLAVERENSGYWLPMNVNITSNLTSLVSTSQVMSEIDKMKSQQVLVITNAYFGYDIFEPSESFHKKDATSINFQKEINDFKGRQVITSGGIQPILSEDAIYSEFGISLFYYLERNEKGRLDAFSLYQNIQTTIQNVPSKPEIGHLKNAEHEGGQFVFKGQQNVCNLEIAEGDKITYYASGTLTANSTCTDCDYKWYLNDKVISDKNEAFVCNSNTYKVIMTDDNNCKIEKEIAVVIEKESMMQSDPMEDN